MVDQGDAWTGIHPKLSKTRPRFHVLSTRDVRANAADRGDLDLRHHHQDRQGLRRLRPPQPPERLHGQRAQRQLHQRKGGAAWRNIFIKKKKLHMDDTPPPPPPRRRSTGSRTRWTA